MEDKQIKNKLIYIVDPFNKLYNPAKTVSLKNDILKIWEVAYKKL